MFSITELWTDIFTLTDEQGVYLVKLARQVIESKLGLDEVPIPVTDDPVLNVNCGVFVTLNEHAKGNRGLRGCIGLPYPTTPLVEAVMQAANSAAFEDPRFPSVQPNEMGGLTIEISVLTPPEKIEEKDPIDLSNHVQVGRDGLIIGRGWNKGLLLPQVPVEWGWDSTQFLDQCCVKAGLPPRSWLEPDTEVYTFQAILFKEDDPRGNIRRHRLSD
jgi:uncharacterized protein (TIGR00296 family)